MPVVRDGYRDAKAYRTQSTGCSPLQGSREEELAVLSGKSVGYCCFIDERLVAGGDRYA